MKETITRDMVMIPTDTMRTIPGKGALEVLETPEAMDTGKVMRIPMPTEAAGAMKTQVPMMVEAILVDTKAREPTEVPVGGAIPVTREALVTPAVRAALEETAIQRVRVVPKEKAEVGVLMARVAQGGMEARAVMVEKGDS